jgi:hypothetical protein
MAYFHLSSRQPGDGQGMGVLVQERVLTFRHGP